MRSGIFIFIFSVTAIAVTGVSQEKPVDFAREIYPLLSQRCFQCHGDKKHEGGLRFDLRSAALRGGDSGKVILPGKSADSALLKRIRSSDPDEQMPPKGKRLTAEEVSRLQRWLDQGASWPDALAGRDKNLDHWAFQAIQRPPLPARSSSATRDAIDLLVQMRLTEKGLKPAAAANPYTLLRRLHLDLTGIPPSDEQIRQFIQASAKDAEKAYQQAVDRLLKSPHFGERWAMDWLDLGRYADSDGYEKDLPRPHAWRWRNWLIDAINRDLPFDQFTEQQLAGDLLPGATEQVQLATGFHRNTLTNREGGVDQEEYRVKAVVDRVNTTLTVWMGLTVGCAECHSHKYDPISQHEFYGLYAFFNNADEKDLSVAAAPPLMAKYQQQKEAHDARLAKLQTMLDQQQLEQPKRFEAWQGSLKTDQTPWSPLKIVAAEKTSLPQLKHHPDGSLSVIKLKARSSTIELSGSVNLKTVTALRIEALLDDQLPNKGPGLAIDGSFSLSGISATVNRGKDAAPQQLLLDTVRDEINVGNTAINNVLIPSQSAGWQQAGGKPGSLVLGVAAKASKQAWLGNPLQTSMQDGATAMLNIYHGSPLPAAGTIDRLRFWSKATEGAASDLYLLRPTGKGTYYVVYKHPFKAKASNGEVELILPQPWQGQRGDLLAHSGNGSAAYQVNAQSTDVLYYPLKAFPNKNQAFDLATYPVFKQKRQYNLQANFTPLVTTPTASNPQSETGELSLTVKLQHTEAGKSLGRFRISATDSSDPLGIHSKSTVPKDVLAITGTAVDQRTDKQQARLLKYYQSIDPQTAPLRKQLSDLRKKAPKKPTATAHVMQKRGSPRTTHLHVRGNFLERGDEVTTHTPQFLHPFKARGPQADRLDLARWIMDEKNPLTARVAVNRIWAHLFGQGLVKTSEDFGTQGETPANAKLLDWLASEFVTQGWSRKQLIRLIVSSHTYRQASTEAAQQLEIDPENLLLSRQNRFRLQGELIRDGSLAAAGLLNRTIGGASFRPPLPAGTAEIQFVNKWVADKGDLLLRRGMYIHLQRNLLLPMLLTFDQPDSIVTCTRRARSNTPLQALTQLNAPTFVQSAKALGLRLAQTPSADPQQRIRLAYRLTVCREPTDFELTRVGQLQQELLEIYRQDPKSAGLLVADNKLANVPVEELASWISIARTILNLDEMITRE
jgi:mono/diheme cytochrome c family protein